MAILVDELREYPHTPLPFRHWCHMVSDTALGDPLTGFAAALGLAAAMTLLATAALTQRLRRL